MSEPAAGHQARLDTVTLEAAMRRAIELAQLGPADNENPQVGCVIVASDGSFVGEGWHRGAGTPHAEVDALANLPETWRNRMDELTAVVTLEPCNHQGRTGPCAKALVDAEIGAVAYALSDPGVASSGGAVRLSSAGMALRSGILAANAKAMLGGWLARHADATSIVRPRITVKWAQSLDGRIAAADGSSQWLTSVASRRDVHQRRAAADGILVGTGTLLADDPALTARAADGSLLAAQPKPIVMGERPIPADAKIRSHPGLAPGEEPFTLSGRMLEQELSQLVSQGIRSIFVEGGASVISALIREHLVDELLVYVAPVLLGGSRVAVDDIGVANLVNAQSLNITEITRFENDTLFIARPVSA